MKKIAISLLSITIKCGATVAFALLYISGNGQQLIGSFPEMEGNFENVATDSITSVTVAAGTQLTKWTGAHSGSTSKARINTSIVRTGSKALEWVCGSTSAVLLSKSANNMAIASNTTYVVQFYWWKGYSGQARDFPTSLGPAGTNNMGTTTSSVLGVSAPSFEWTKETIIITTGTNNSNPRYGLVRLQPNGGSFSTSPGYVFDDFCVYPGSAADITAPGDATDPVVTGYTSTSLSLSWTAPAGGVDGGGYVVVRYTSNPVSEPSPNVNGIYAPGNSLGTGTIAYIGTANSFTDNGLSPNTAYYYKVYVADKAFNYSPNPTVFAGFTGIAGPTAISFTTPATCITNQVTISWTGPLNYNSANYTLLGFLKAGSAVTVGTPSATPATYTASTTFGSGTAYQNDAAAYCIINGDGTNSAGDHSGLTITGLAPGTTYHLLLFNVLNASNTYSAGSMANGTTLSAIAEPANQPGSFTNGTLSTSNIPLSWSAAGGTPAPNGYLIQASSTAIPANPTDFTDPVNQTNISSGTANVKTAGTSYSGFTGFTAGTMYYFSINSYTNSGACIDFKIPGPAINVATLPNAVTSPALSIAGGIGTINWTAATGYNNANHTTLVFVSSSPISAGTPTATPSTYTANTAFGAGSAYQLDANARCVYKGDGSSATVTGLTAGTTYYVLILTVVDAANYDGTCSYSAYATTSALYNAATEYTWIGGASGSWATSTNWTPTRSSPSTADVLIFNTAGNVTATSVPAQTIAKLVINAGNVTLQSGSAVTLTITDNDGTAFTDLLISGNTSLTLGSSVNITLSANTTASIVGTLNINTSRTYNTDNSGCITTISGTVNNQGTYTCTNAARTVVNGGGIYNHNVNNGTLPLATWNFNSACQITGVTTIGNFSSATHGQTFSKFIWDCASQNSPTDAGQKRFVLGAGGINTTTGPFMVVTDSFIVKRTNGCILQLASTGGQRDFTCGNYFQYGGLVAITFNTDAAGEQRSLTVNKTFYLTDSLESNTKFQIINNPAGDNIIGRLFVGGDVEMHPTIAAAIIERIIGGAAALAEIWFNGSSAQNVRFHTISGSVDFVTNHTGSGVWLQSNATANLFKLIRGTFFINGNTLTINNAVSYPAPGTGTIGGSATSNLTIGGTAGTLNFYTGYRTLKDFTLNTNCSAALGTELGIVAGAAPGRLSLASGAILTTNDNLIIRSDNLGTARVAQIPVNGSGVALATVNGKVQVERYLPMALTYDSRRWRLLTAPFKNNANAPSINAGWQEGAVCPDRLNPDAYNPRPGYGTHITVSTVATNGFDQGVRNNPSIYYFNNGSWVAPANTTSTKLTDNNGVYMLFARGDRSIVIVDQFVDARPTTLAPKGELNLGDITIPMASSGMQAVGNPYASQIKLDNISFNGVLGKSKTIYLWDPKSVGSSGVGAFITCSGDGGTTPTYTYTGNASNYNSTPGVIESSGAFMVAATGGNIIFHETDKTTGSSTVGIASRPSPFKQNTDFGRIMKFYTDMYVLREEGLALCDGVANTYNNNYSNSVDEMDAPKLLSFNTREKLMLERNGAILSIERRKEIGNKDTIFLVLHRLNTGTYQFVFRSENFDNNYTALLRDNYSNTFIPIDIINGNSYNFSITADAASFASNRFYIIFSKKTAITGIIAAAGLQQMNVEIEWADTHNNLLKEEVMYEVEKSADGKNFKRTGRLFTSNDLPKWTDEQPAPGLNYYRIRRNDANGNISYSNIVQAEALTSLPCVFPNPVQNGIIHLQMGQLPAGTYTVKILNTQGVVMQKEQFRYAGGHAAQQIISLSKKYHPGIYKLELLCAGKTEAILTLLAQ